MNKTSIKLFPSDKNYILKEVQNRVRDQFVQRMVQKAIDSYFTNHNPLGLLDETTSAIRKYQYSSHIELIEFYNHLAGIYRYQFGENQLEILFDGTPHYDKYRKEWEETFEDWTDTFCANYCFLKAVLQVTVFSARGGRSDLAGNRLKVYLNQQFNLKVYRYKGIQKFAS